MVSVCCVSVSASPGDGQSMNNPPAHRYGLMNCNFRERGQIFRPLKMRTLREGTSGPEIIRALEKNREDTRMSIVKSE